MIIAKCFKKLISATVNKIMKTGLVQDTGGEAAGEKSVSPRFAELARAAAAEGTVLLKNDGVLPLNPDNEIAVFGRCQADYFYVGYGSGGDVNAPYKVNLIDGLRNYGFKLNEELVEIYRRWSGKFANAKDDGWWGAWPMCYPEMPLTKAVAEKAAATAKTAVVVIGRAAGEDRENKLKQGSYYLTDKEIAMLGAVTSAFEKTVVLMDCGNIMDMAWTEVFGDKLSAVVWCWQGGMESGNAVAEVLCGKVNPCGKLTSTIAKAYEDYPSADFFGGTEFNNYTEDIYVGYRYFDTFAPDRVLYPFGFGLSYTDFEVTPLSFERKDGGVTVTVKVTNVGKSAGKEVVELYVHAPCGKLGKADKVLVGFDKTPLLKAGENAHITITVSDYLLSSFDDCGKTGYRNAYVLEKGKYDFFVGGNPLALLEAGGFELTDTILIQQLEEICGVKEPFERLTAAEKSGKTVKAFEPVALRAYDLKQRIIDALPREIPVTGDKGIKLADVLHGTAMMDDFIAQLNDEELERLTRGAGYMNSELGTPGNGGAFGGVYQSLRDKGVPPIITTDGPSGIRLRRYCSLLACGTALACTWNRELLTELGELFAEEMLRFGSDVILGPGMNIHRNPLCGRNFEYFSEDPLVSGRIAAALVRGIQSKGVSACIKHFACNNQETRRNNTDSRVSQRALREIYLKGFELCVKEAAPLNIMTSYNRINGVWSHYNYDLAETALRKEWGYRGNIMTDWWMRSSNSPEFPKLKDHAYRVRAGVDLMMPGNTSHSLNVYVDDGTLRATLGEKDGITRGELQRCARHVLENCLIKLARTEKTAAPDNQNR